MFWLTSSWSGDPVLPAQQTLHPQGLATICQGRHPWRANQATEWSRASPPSPAKRPLVLRVVFEDTVLNQKHSYPCSQSVRVQEVPSVDRQQLPGPPQPEFANSSGFSTLEATEFAGQVSGWESTQEMPSTRGQDGLSFHVFAPWF